VRGKKIETRPPLFVNYCFILIELGWHAARWSIGVVDLIRSGELPARVPDAVIAEIKQRENSRGYVELPERILRLGDALRVLAGPLRGLDGLYDGMRGHERCAILLSLFGGSRLVVLPHDQIKAV
jgi:transcriptional antiterminator RfaH